MQNGVIVHYGPSGGLAATHYPELYLGVLHHQGNSRRFAQLKAETARPEFRMWSGLPLEQQPYAHGWTASRSRKGQAGISLQRVLLVRCTDRRRCYENVSRRNLGELCPEHRARPPGWRRKGLPLSKQCGTPLLSEWRTIRTPTCPWAFRSSRSEGGALAVPGSGISAVTI